MTPAHLHLPPTQLLALACGRGVLARELRAGCGLWRFTGLLLLPVIPARSQHHKHRQHHQPQQEAHLQVSQPKGASENKTRHVCGQEAARQASVNAGQLAPAGPEECESEAPLAKLTSCTSLASSLSASSTASSGSGRWPSTAGSGTLPELPEPTAAAFDDSTLPLKGSYLIGHPSAFPTSTAFWAHYLLASSKGHTQAAGADTGAKGGPCATSAQHHNAAAQERAAVLAAAAHRLVTCTCKLAAFAAIAVVGLEVYVHSLQVQQLHQDATAAEQSDALAEQVEGGSCARPAPGVAGAMLQGVMAWALSIVCACVSGETDGAHLSILAHRAMV